MHTSAGVIDIFYVKKINVNITFYLLLFWFPLKSIYDRLSENASILPQAIRQNYKLMSLYINAVKSQMKPIISTKLIEVKSAISQATHSRLWKRLQKYSCFQLN